MKTDDLLPSSAKGADFLGRIATPAGQAPDRVHQAFRELDRGASALVAQFTGGLSPTALGLAYADWALHLLASPGKRTELALDGWRNAIELSAGALRWMAAPGAAGRTPAARLDERFRNEAWERAPYRFWRDGFLLTQRWWHDATHGVRGVSPHHQDVVSFMARQLLDVCSPANMPWANPEVVDRTVQTAGCNLAEGAAYLAEDVQRALAGQLPAGTERFRIGRDLAATPGKVVWRNRLIELIQYAPATDTVHAEPVLLVPAWIMKYYILDLSPHNSLVRFLVERGHTVFCVSWRNVTPEDRDLGLEDYRRLGVMEALDAIGAIVPDQKVHAVGYCLGGTLLAIAAAAMAGAGDDRLATVTLLAAQTDFTEPGEIQLFIDHGQVALLDAVMSQRGVLEAHQMAGSFQMLRSNDLIWSRIMREYWMGERPTMIDLMAWNVDTTRMPYRMHSEYLHRLFLDNELASDRYLVDGHPVAIRNLHMPLFVVGTERDHIAPWRSVYKIHYLSDADLTFVLASGGHNAGIVSEPGRPRRHFRMRHEAAGEPCIGPDQWVASTPALEGSWWTAWQAWLARHSSPDLVAPPALGAPQAGYPALADAPGSYVFQR